jgi:serine/threonine protein kinase
MGEVYRALDSVLERPVAVKLLANRFAQEADARARFQREARAAARLSSSSHVVTVFDVGEHEGRPLIVMELVEGGSVQDALEHGPVSREQALKWLSQAAEALDRAHAEGVVHRDVKPSNLLLDREGSVRVSDFGIASTSGVDTITLPGTILGTVGYLSPEQARGEPATPASDRYGLAVVAFELLTRRRPFASESATTEVFGHLNGAIPDASSLASDLPSSVDAVFRRALAKDPAERPASCADLVRELSLALDQPVSESAARRPVGADVDAAPVRQPTTWFRARTVRRGAGIAIASGVVLATGVVVAILVSAGGHQSSAASVPPRHSTTSTTTTSTPHEPDGTTLDNQGYALMQDGNFADALPPLRQAVLALAGTSSLTEAYANYNLAYTLFALGNCAGVTAPLALSESIQGHRSEIDALRARWQARCAPASAGKGHGKGHDHGGGQDNGDNG